MSEAAEHVCAALNMRVLLVCASTWALLQGTVLGARLQKRQSVGTPAAFRARTEFVATACALRGWGEQRAFRL